MTSADMDMCIILSLNPGLPGKVTGGHLLEPCGSVTSGEQSLFFDFNHH